ncbi:hypothetical protein BDB00DRAFT_840070 [Zychaea mexicana]|uniref:uncharacterized protein n=1 Tax=Zychaea mexicana TaxID=64656 RepID=UPI0022FE8BFE|nr:uncharacterized protein BDB00DRAFT_840070 [Zychaea mexicana]KAI9489929.1 hypothetical protein BDB00DRAFT_840070 [Zychaea mexicana]
MAPSLPVAPIHSLFAPLPAFLQKSPSLFFLDDLQTGGLHLFTSQALKIVVFGVSSLQSLGFLVTNGPHILLAIHADLVGHVADELKFLLILQQRPARAILNGLYHYLVIIGLATFWWPSLDKGHGRCISHDSRADDFPTS